MIMLMINLFLLIINLKFIICQSLQDQQPRGIHLVYGEDPTSQLNVFWWTKAKTTSAVVYYSLVDTENEYETLHIGICNHNQSAKGFLARNQTNGKFIQRVLIKNLLPNRLYCYEIKSGDTTSNIYTFRTAGPSLDYHKINYKNYINSNFIVYGGETELENSIRNLIFPQSFQENLLNKFKMSHLYALINMGDIYLKEYSLTNSNDEKDFFESGAEIFSRLPILPTFGSFYDLTNLKLFRNMFTFINEWPLKSFWYSFDINGVHFISYSTDLFIINENMNKNNTVNNNNNNDITNILDAQINWLKDDLEKANKNRFSIPWIIVLARQPMYCLNNCLLYCKKDDSKNCIQKDEIIRKKLESMFYHYGVDLVLESSEKTYSRTFPVIKNGEFYETSYNNIDMPIHISIPRTISTEDNFSQNNKNWVAFTYNSESNFNFGQITVVNYTHLKWSYMLPNDTIIDSITIIKNFHGLLNSESSLERKIIQNENKIFVRQRIFKIVSITSVCLILIIFLVLFAIFKRHQNNQKLKNSTQYANLIESEFDT